MSSGATGGSTIKFHRVIKAPPERVYRAFVDPRARVKWLPPHGYVGEVQSSDARVGGTYKMSFTSMTSGQTQRFGGTYTEMKPGERLRYTDRFDDPNLPGEMATTVTFKKIQGGTDLTITQEDVPAAIPAEMCYVGWQESLNQLAVLVEAEVP